MDRTKFLMSLTRQGKMAIVHDVGEVSITENSVRPRRSCTTQQKIENQLHSEITNELDNFDESETSWSEYIPPSQASSSNNSIFYDLNSWDQCEKLSLSPVIPIQPTINNKQSSPSSQLQNGDSVNQDTDEMFIHTPIEEEQNNILNISDIQNLNYTDNIEDVVPRCTSSINLEQVNKNSETFESGSKPREKFADDLYCYIAKRKDQGEYTKKQSAPERPTICPICFNDVPTHFTRHLLRHHSDNKEVKIINSLKPKSKQRLELVSALRKQGYFHLNIEKGVLNAVRTSKNLDKKYSVCTYCLGHYSKKSLFKHVKTCKSKPENILKPGKNILAKSQTFMATMTSRNHNFLKTSRIKAEVFNIMRPDDISSVVKTDPLICLYGETLLNKHKRKQISTVVSNKMREMARLLIAMRSINTEVKTLFDAMKPECFQLLISAAKIISGFNIETKTFKSPSLALHMGTNLKLICDVCFKIVIEKRNIPNIIWSNREEKKKEIKELKKLIAEHWCHEVSSLALKNIKENQWEKPIQLPLTSDIQAFQFYLDKRADEAYVVLAAGQRNAKNYQILTQCVLALTVLFNRKRIGDVQFLKIETYTADKSTSNQEAFMDSLTPVEKILINKFKRVVTGGKGSKPVPILFSRKIQKFIECLIEIRKNGDIVPLSNPYLFANPGSEDRWMSGTNVIRRLAEDCGVNNPALLTSTKFRKHIATTLQLMTMEENEMEQVAKFMGHTKKTHAEFYRLPQDIYQTAKVAKILLMLDKGKGKDFHGKSLDEIFLDKDVYYSSESESDEDDKSVPLSERLLNRTLANKKINPNLKHDNETITKEKSDTEEDVNKKTQAEINFVTKEKEIPKFANEIKKKGKGRSRWTAQEQKIVIRHFQHHIKKKITPKKEECNELISRNKDILRDKDWVKVKTFVYNTFKKLS